MSERRTGYELAVKLALPCLLAVCAWTLAQEHRLTTLEVRSEAIVEDVQEIKADVKKLLGGTR